VRNPAGPVRNPAGREGLPPQRTPPGYPGGRTIRSDPRQGERQLEPLVTVALREYAARRRVVAFDAQISAMAADPLAQAECAIIGKEFSVADMDGLR